MIKSYQRGHEIIYNAKQGKWIYADNGEGVEIERPCKRCERMPTVEGHDACLGELKDVSFACCGHGVQKSYFGNIDIGNNKGDISVKANI